MSLTAFVTGASGFVGSNLVKELHGQGWAVHILARPTSSLGEIEGIPYTLHEGDIVDAESLEGAVPAHADALFHCAASTNFWSRNNSMQTRVNVDGTANVMEAALKAGVRRFIHTSSFVTWGFQGGSFTETSPRDTGSDWINYVRTKHLSEQMVLDAVAEEQLDAVVLNPANVLGPGDFHNWSRLIRIVNQQKLPAAPPGGGNFCDVREVARAHVRAFHDGRSGEKYLLGGDYSTYRDVIRQAAELLDRKEPPFTLPPVLFRALSYVMTPLASMAGSEPDITPESAAMSAREIRCDSGKAERELAYRSIPVKDMLTDTIDWMRKEGLL